MSTDFFNPVSSSDPSIGVIFVPQGMEHKIVSQSIVKKEDKPLIVAIPVGINPTNNYLRTQAQCFQWIESLAKGVLVMGLCGSLAPEYEVGQGVLYNGCGYVADKQWQWERCYMAFNDLIEQNLGDRVVRVKGISCEQVITSIAEKQHLRQKYEVDVVDMEGFAILRFCNARGIPCTMLRVVSDENTQVLPDLTSAYDEQGQLNPVKLGLKMLKAPLSSAKLIQSSLIALQHLKSITHALNP